MTRRRNRMTLGALTAIAIGVFTALAVAAGAYGDSRLSVERSGDPQGRAVVFVPGLATGGAVFEDAAASLSGVDVHLVTLGGFAGAPAPDSLDLFIAPAAAALADYLKAEGLSDAVLVGHSLGGQVALIAAGTAPDRVGRVLLVDSAPFFAGLMQPGADPETVAARRDQMVDRIAAMPRKAFLSMMRQGLPVQAASEPAQARIFDWIEASDQRAVAVASAEIFAGDLRGRLDAVQTPVTLVYPQAGMMDPHLVAERYRAQYERLDAFEMRPVDESRHFVMLDQPDRFAEELARVVEDQ